MTQVVPAGGPTPIGPLATAIMAVVRSPGPDSIALLVERVADTSNVDRVVLASTDQSGELRALLATEADVVAQVSASGEAAEAMAAGAPVTRRGRAVIPVVDGQRAVGVLVVEAADTDLDPASLAWLTDLCTWALGGARSGPPPGAADPLASVRDARDEAESDRDEARRAQQLAESALDVARRAQQLAESDRDSARHAQQLAESARDVARRAQQLAESDRDLARDALQEARADRVLAEVDRDVRAEEARLNAEAAGALVRTVLPRELPRLAGVSLSAHYSPAATTGIVGGDWYDAMVLPDGRLFCSVGDATGNGLPAATVMGRLANAARVAALIDPDPAAVVAVLDRALRAHDARTLATAVVALYDPERGALRWARAGHPPPAVARPHDGVALLEPPARPPLGAPTDAVGAPPPVHEVHLPPGSVCALFTDGLVERRGEHIDDGLARVADALDLATPPDHAERIATRIVDACAPHDPDDDVCLLVLSTH